MENKKITMETRMIGLVLAFALLSISFVFALHPDGPDSIDIVDTTQKANLTAQVINTSGGTITTVNITSVVINPRWKAFVGNVSGTFVLSDATGNRIYDWEISKVLGVVFASRENGTGAIKWGTTDCSTTVELQTEQTAMAHTNPNDNLTKTFGDDGNNHPAFYVGSSQIAEDACPYSLSTESGTPGEFTQVVLNDKEDGDKDTIYASILAENKVGYNGDSYDFQMIVPERGAEGFTGKTAYYLYVQLV